MAKITVLEQKTFEGKPSGFKVTLDNGTSGNLQEKESDKNLRVGDEVFVTLIPYTSKKGVVSQLLGLKLAQNMPPQQSPQAPQPPQTKPSVAPSSLSPTKAQATIKAMEFCVNMFIADKLTWDQISPKHKELTGYLIDAIDECNA